MNESQVHEMKKHLQQQKLSFDKERAVYELQISQLNEKLRECELKYETYKKSRELLVDFFENLTDDNFAKLYEKFSSRLTEVQNITEQSTKNIKDAINQMLFNGIVS